MFRLTDISKDFGHGFRLSIPDLTLPACESTTLIGPSGSGKSTLLRLLLGLLWPDWGTLSFEEHPLTRSTLIGIRRRMGFVPQSGGLFPHLTAEGNVTLMARREGWTRARIADRVDALARMTHLPREALRRYPTQLSGGQRQRVSLMRALMRDPDVLLLDEPLGALDPLIRFELQTDLKSIFDSLGKTVVLVTHDLSEAAFFSRRIVLLRDGRVVQQGLMTDLIHRPADPFISRFVNAQRSAVTALSDATRP